MTIAAHALIFRDSTNDIVSGSVSPAMTKNASIPAPVSKKVIMNFVTGDRRMTSLIFLKVLFIIYVFISCSLWPGGESNPLYVLTVPKSAFHFPLPKGLDYLGQGWGGRHRPYAEQLTVPPDLALNGLSAWEIPPGTSRNSKQCRNRTCPTCCTSFLVYELNFHTFVNSLLEKKGRTTIELTANISNKSYK